MTPLRVIPRHEITAVAADGNYSRPICGEAGTPMGTGRCLNGACHSRAGDSR